MENRVPKKCVFLAVEPSGMLEFKIDDAHLLTVLQGARISPDNAVAANVFLTERAPCVDLRCIVFSVGPPAVSKVELLAWRDKSGEVWQNLAMALIEQGLAEPTNTPP
ncbi:MAG: hypothetical protein OEW08_03865 [Gammaproteobacteria bacterium]|nr:hypothetical protein [Gammaproteobacteria bacterium]